MRRFGDIAASWVGNCSSNRKGRALHVASKTYKKALPGSQACTTSKPRVYKRSCPGAKGGPLNLFFLFLRCGLQSTHQGVSQTDDRMSVIRPSVVSPAPWSNQPHGDPRWKEPDPKGILQPRTTPETWFGTPLLQKGEQSQAHTGGQYAFRGR